MSHLELVRKLCNKASDNDYSLTYSELGGSRIRPMETEHDNLQAVAAVGAFEEAREQQVRGHRRRQVDPPVCQAVTVKTQQTLVRVDLTYATVKCFNFPVDLP